MGARHRPRRARSCELAWRPAGVVGERPGGGGGGGASCLFKGCLGLGTLPHPAACLSGRQPGLVPVGGCGARGARGARGVCARVPVWECCGALCAVVVCCVVVPPPCVLVPCCPCAPPT